MLTSRLQPTPLLSPSRMLAISNIILEKSGGKWRTNCENILSGALLDSLYIIAFNSHNNPMRQIIFLFHSQGHWDLERLNNLWRITRLAKGTELGLKHSYFHYVPGHSSYYLFAYLYFIHLKIVLFTYSKFTRVKQGDCCCFLLKGNTVKHIESFLFS